MARFSFPVPGRKKQASGSTLNEPMSKAHQILGPASLSVDDSKNWDGVSNSGISVTVTDSTSPCDGQSDFSARRAEFSRSRRDWGDDSDILPQQYRSNRPGEEAQEFASDISGTLTIRKQPSSSTITSWYDKSKEPLSVTQQTSASAMAKGPPSKAQRMLDMDNSLAGATPLKQKKKPARLDLSSSTANSRGSRFNVDGQEHNGPLLSQDYVMRSPSLLSQLTPPAGGRRLQKRSTRESLRSANASHAPQTTQHTRASEAHRPVPNGSPRVASHFPNGVPDLYEHYEQMSLRQIMDLETEPGETIDRHLESVRQARSIKPTVRHTQSEREIRKPRALASHTRQNSYSSSMAKIERVSPSTSISSRNTRTSRASKHAESSFLDADLQGKSVLSLSSSDSEDDEYDEPVKNPAPGPARRPSDVDRTPWRRDSSPAPSRATRVSCDGSDQQSTKSSKSGKRASFAPFHTYLPLPSAPVLKSPSVSSQGTSPSVSTFNIPTSPSRVSVLSNSSASTALTWQSKAGYGVQQARAVTVMPAQGPSGYDTDIQSENGHRSRSPIKSPIGANSVAPSTDQPTPPLSPSSVDSYIRTATAPNEQPLAQNRFMAVTPHEEMLLAALRQKRQYMSHHSQPEQHQPQYQPLPQPQPPADRRVTRGHRSQASDATITQFDFDFPDPSSQEESGAESSSSSMIDRPAPTDGKFPWSNDVFTQSASDVVPALSPAPARTASHQRKGILKNSASRRSQLMSRHVHQPDRSVSPRTVTSEEAEPAHDLGEIIDFDEQTSRAPGTALPSSINLNSFPQPRAPPRRANDLVAAHRSSLTKHHQNYKGGRLMNSGNMIARIDEDAPAPEADGPGVPRPDSPISPEAFPAPPTRRATIEKKLARLSAVGSSRLGEEPGWWGHDD